MTACRCARRHRAAGRCSDASPAAYASSSPQQRVESLKANPRGLLKGHSGPMTGIPDVDQFGRFAIARHAQKTNLQRPCGFEDGAKALLDHAPLSAGRGEDRLDLEAAQVTRPRPPPEPHRLPAGHVPDLPSGHRPGPAGKPNVNRLNQSGNLVSISAVAEIAPELLASKSRASRLPGAANGRFGGPVGFRVADGP